MDLKEFQSKCEEAAIYDREKYSVVHPLTGLNGKVGTILSLIEESMRYDDGELTQERKDEIAEEIGNCFWFAAMFCSDAVLRIEKVFPVLSSSMQDIVPVLNLASRAIKQSSDALHQHVEVKYHQPYLASMCVTECLRQLMLILQDIGYEFEEVLEAKVKKLADRKARGVIAGSGDNR